MNILPDDIKSPDPIDRLIFEKGIRLQNLYVDKNLDLLVLILNNGKLLKTKISYFSSLNNASQNDLEAWNLIGQGIGVRWEKFDEDLSLKGFIKEAALKNMLSELESENEQILV